MKTVVISDLHLGAGTDADLLRRTPFREPLLAEVAGADRVVLLGDALELRDRPVNEVVDIAAPFFSELGEALGAGEVVVVPGNHDHHLVEPWLERRLLDGAEPLGLEQRTAPDGALATLARRMGEATVEIAYPGLWLTDGVYATHGHYLDRHLTIPTFERLGVAAVERVLGMQPAGPDPLDPRAASILRKDQYERAQGPIYALHSTPWPRGPTPTTPARATRPSACGARSPAVARGRRRCAAGCSARSRCRGPSESPTGSASDPSSPTSPPARSPAPGSPRWATSSSGSTSAPRP